MNSSLSARLARLDIERFEHIEDYAVDALPVEFLFRMQEGKESAKTLIALARPFEMIEVELYSHETKGLKR